jgi:uncharacterized protein (DUF1015 family)
MSASRHAGLSLAPFRAIRPSVDGPALARRLCPPYDVIDETERARLLAQDPTNAVSVILPRAEPGVDAYRQAAEQLQRWVTDDEWQVDPVPAIYVYEMATPGNNPVRGLLGAIELRDPADGVILPHENTMAGPVADRLALMTATQADLEPIYLVYDGGGAASQAVAASDAYPLLATATTGDDTTHRLWAITDERTLIAIAEDLSTRRALIADGHHRYATYRELQHTQDQETGPGPWDRGLTLLVDSQTYGPQVHAIHRVLPGFSFAHAIAGATGHISVESAGDLSTSLDRLARSDDFAVVITDGEQTAILTDPNHHLGGLATRPDEPAELSHLDVVLLHRGLVEGLWQLADTVDAVGYAHSVDEAIANARATAGTAVLLRPTPIASVAAVAAAGARMPRKSTLFTPKPASGLVMRRFADDQ